MFKPGTVDIPMALYTLAPLVGPCLGPLLGGFINQNTTFRVTFYTVIAWSGLTFVLLYLLVPETFLPKILQREATKKRLETGDGKWYAPLDRTARTVGDVFPSAMWQPIQMMIKEPMALILNCWTALVLGVIYLFFNAIPFTFRTVYGL
jgi:MFS family permease